MSNQERGEGIISNILAIAGFIILIVIIIWGAFHFLNLASSGFSSLLGRAGANQIQVTAPKTVNSGQPLDVTWKYTVPTGEGSFALLYQCKEGFQFRMPLATSTNPVPCGSAYTVANKDAKTIRLIPVLASGESVDIPVSIIYMAQGTTTDSVASRAQGNVTITVTTASVQNTPTTGATGTTGTTPTQHGTGGAASTPTAGAVSTPVSGPSVTGSPDLAVRILSVGVIDPMSGNIVGRNPINAQEVVAVTFDIKNQGGSPTGVWYFTAQLPTTPRTPYVSPAQRSLGIGDHIENTLRFNQVISGGSFTVSVDPSNTVSESNESNNYASHAITGYTYQYQEPYYQY